MSQRPREADREIKNTGKEPTNELVERDKQLALKELRLVVRIE